MKITGFPGFDAAAAASGLVRARVTDLTAQVASGQRAQTFAGLGEEAGLALDLRSERARREAVASAARRAEAFAEATQTALGGIYGSARDILDNAQRVLVTGLPGSSPTRAWSCNAAAPNRSPTSCACTTWRRPMW